MKVAGDVLLLEVEDGEGGEGAIVNNAEGGSGKGVLKVDEGWAPSAECASQSPLYLALDAGHRDLVRRQSRGSRGKEGPVARM